MRLKKFKELPLTELMGPSSDYNQYKVQEKITVKDAAAQISDNELHMVVVVDEQENVIGVLTDTDLSRKIGSGINLSNQGVDEVMNKSITSVTESATIATVLNTMKSSGHNKVIVKTSDGKFRGVYDKKEIVREIKNRL